MKKKSNTRLKNMRLALNMTQQDLSTASGVNIKSIASYEQSEDKINKASVSTVLSLADALGCSVEDLIVRHKENSNDKASVV